MSSSAHVIETAEQTTQPAREAARSAARDGSMASMREATERLRSSARHAADNADEYVHSNPWMAVGIAAAAGAAITMLLGMRMKP
jgi:ElaB/YqjD/DUF883 family membrane-anchored ribosome-binding protein